MTARKKSDPALLMMDPLERVWTVHHDGSGYVVKCDSRVVDSDMSANAHYTMSSALALISQRLKEVGQ